MAAIRFCLPVLICNCIIFYLTKSCYSAKLNVPKLLLPYHSSVSTNFTLEISQGCFTWRSTRPEIASVRPMTGDDINACSQFATVYATSRTPSRKTAIVIAQDPVTGQQLRCDVIIDEITAIDIETTTKELYLDDSPEEFVIRAMNQEDDVFSSVEGLPFEWNLLTDTESGSDVVIPAHNVLRFLKFSESLYKGSRYIRELEDEGRRGDRILIRGMRTGSALVSVRPADPVYKGVRESVVRIVVVANLQLNPPLIYLLPFTTVRYTVELLKQGKAHPVQMPSPQYYLEIEDPNLASLDSKSSTVTALELGDTEIKLKDRNVKLSGAFREPSGGIYVVTPGYLGFTVQPGNVWVLETGRNYEVFVDVFDKESHRVFPSGNIRIETLFPDKFFEVEYSSMNGTYHIVKTLKPGFPDIDGELKAILRSDGSQYVFNPTIDGSQEVEIYDPISVIPKLLVLPWTPGVDTGYSYQLQAEGGSGNYSWHSENISVATVSTTGVIRTETATGETKVKVADTRNSMHQDTMMTMVLPPSSMAFLPSRVEVEIGSKLHLPLAVYSKLAGTRQQFTDCQRMPLQVKVTDSASIKFVRVSEPGESGACASIEVEGLSVGNSEVLVSYQYLDINLRASLTVAAYRPLRPVDPEEFALVTPAASKLVVFDGGPQPWTLDRTKYFQKANLESPELVTLNLVKDYTTTRGQHVLLVLCQKLGEQEITLTVGNGPTKFNLFPASATSSIRFVCAQPHGLHIVPAVTFPADLPPCPMSPQFDDPFPLFSRKDVDLLVSVTDLQGRRFDNFSSLAIEWNLDDHSLADFRDAHSLTTDIVIHESGKRQLKHFKGLGLKQHTGQITVTASVARYNAKYSDLKVAPRISTKRVFSLVDSPVVNPAKVTLYNHPSNKMALTVEQGSGYFHVSFPETNAAKIAFDSKLKEIQMVPNAEGSISLSAYDLCLDPTQKAIGSVFISDVYQILLTVVDKVEIGREIVARVRVLDRQDQAIPSRYFSMMSLQHHLASDLVTLRPSPNQSGADDFTAFFIVTGVSLGRTTLKFTARGSSAMISSTPREIQVFPPLRLEPRNITLIIGSSFQVTASGGPQPESTIEFSVDNSTVSLISSSGLLDTREPGMTRVTGKAVGTDQDSGHVVYSQDEMEVHVVRLAGVKIWTPLKRLQTGTQMPMYAVGLGENEQPFSFGSARPPISFHWGISNKDVADVKPLFYKSGIVPQPEGNFDMRFFADKAGHVSVTLTIDPHSPVQVKDDVLLSDSVQIQVFERLQLINPDVCDGVMLITPNTATQLKTNRDGSTAKVTYSVIGHDVSRHDNSALVTVDEGGHVTAGDEHGQASVLITSHEDFGVNQSLIILVKVKPVSYLMVMADTFIHTHGKPLSSVPVGTSLDFSVSFHDDVGEKFFDTNSKIQFRTNRFDRLQFVYGVDNNTLVSRATDIGQTILKVWDQSNPHLVDYVNIDVGVAIKPSDAVVTLGSVICFHSPLVSPDGHPGVWYSSWPGVQVDQRTGIAMVTQVGSAVITYVASQMTSTKVELTVSPVTRLHLKNENVLFLSNVAPNSRSDKHITVRLETKDRSFKTSLMGENCSSLAQNTHNDMWRAPFHCEVTMTTPHPHVLVQDLVQAVAHFQPNTGLYECQLIQPSSPPADLLPVISSLDTSIRLRAVVPERQGQPEVASDPLTLPYLPGFHLFTRELAVTNLSPVMLLRVAAIDEILLNLKVSSSDPSLVHIGSPEREQHTDHIAQYPISLQVTTSLWERNQLDVSLELKCLSTGQTVKVPVRVSLVGHKGDGPPATGWQLVWLALVDHYQGILTVLVLIMATVLFVMAIQARRLESSGVHTSFVQPGSPMQQQQGIPTSPFLPQGNVSQSPQRLWSSPNVDYGPYDTTALFKRSPLHTPHQ